MFVKVLWCRGKAEGKDPHHQYTEPHYHRREFWKNELEVPIDARDNDD
jgi:hypothetical protein